MKTRKPSPPAPAPVATPNAAATDTTREKLLAAAIGQFGEHGYDGTSIRDIARAAGANVALVSYHFGGKERLYHELLRHLVSKRVRAAFAGISGPVPANPTPAQARGILKAILRGFIESSLGSRDILLAARLIIREQTRPTAGFDIVYDSGMETMHKTVTRLLAIATGRKPETQQSILRAHMLVGQMFAFVFANAAICRRLGKKTLDRRTLTAIAAILNENIDALTKPTSAKPTSAKPARK
jgi:AcrR family transcriptional regulator